MNKLGFATIVAGGLATAVLGLAAPAVAAPSGPGNAQNAIDQLDDRGYAVRIDHQGMVKPLDQSNIVSVRYDNTDRIVFVTVR
jgi:transketolase C-terminal domain/subunit